MFLKPDSVNGGGGLTEPLSCQRLLVCFLSWEMWLQHCHAKRLGEFPKERSRFWCEARESGWHGGKYGFDLHPLFRPRRFTIKPDWSSKAVGNGGRAGGRASWSHGAETKKHRTKEGMKERRKAQTLIIKRKSSYTTLLHTPFRVRSLECAVLADAIGAVIDFEWRTCRKCLREIFFFSRLKMKHTWDLGQEV